MRSERKTDVFPKAETVKIYSGTRNNYVASRQTLIAGQNNATVSLTRLNYKTISESVNTAVVGQTKVARVIYGPLKFVILPVSHWPDVVIRDERGLYES